MFGLERSLEGKETAVIVPAMVESPRDSKDQTLVEQEQDFIDQPLDRLLPPS